MVPSIHDNVDVDVVYNTCQQNNKDDVSSSSNGSFRSCRSRLNVSFSNQVAIKEVLHVREYTSDEITDSWYTFEDVSKFKRETKQMARNEIPVDCPRGLKGKCIPGAQKKTNMRRMARFAVLKEQVNQRQVGVSDPELIADIYFMYNEQCQIEAYMMAVRDEKEARMILCQQENSEFP